MIPDQPGRPTLAGVGLFHARMLGIFHTGRKIGIADKIGKDDRRSPETMEETRTIGG
jgi:hypothetical protein